VLGQHLNESVIVIIVGIMLAVSLLMYTFDAWLGWALGIVTVIVGLIAALKAAASSTPDDSHEKRRVNWDEEEPTE
jgi:cadmium resistance protein CadD (predicted permease)